MRDGNFLAKLICRCGDEKCKLSNSLIDDWGATCKGWEGFDFYGWTDCFTDGSACVVGIELCEDRRISVQMTLRNGMVSGGKNGEQFTQLANPKCVDEIYRFIIKSLRNNVQVRIAPLCKNKLIIDNLEKNNGQLKG